LTENVHFKAALCADVANKQQYVKLLLQVRTRMIFLRQNPASPVFAGFLRVGQPVFKIFVIKML